MREIIIGGVSNELAKPASNEDIQNAVNILNKDIPDALKSLWRASNGVIFKNSNVYLYSANDIVERNDTNEIDKYEPKKLLIGDDGGGNGFFMDSDHTALAVYKIELGAVGSDDGTLVSEDFIEWIAQGGIQTKDTSVGPINPKVKIILVREPRDGLKGLFEINKKLHLDHSIQKLKGINSNIPYVLLENVFLSKYEKLCSEINATQNCLEIAQ